MTPVTHEEGANALHTAQDLAVALQAILVVYRPLLVEAARMSPHSQRCIAEAFGASVVRGLRPYDALLDLCDRRGARG